jgi:hypothetical protein
LGWAASVAQPEGYDSVTTRDAGNRFEPSVKAGEFKALESKGRRGANFSHENAPTQRSLMLVHTMNVRVKPLAFPDAMIQGSFP